MSAPNYLLPKFGEGVVVPRRAVELARVLRAAPLLAAQVWSWRSYGRVVELAVLRARSAVELAERETRRVVELINLQRPAPIASKAAPGAGRSPLQGAGFCPPAEETTPVRRRPPRVKRSPEGQGAKGDP